MEVDILCILVDIKKTYLNVRAKHLKHYSCHLKCVENFELLELLGDSDVGLGHNCKQTLSYNNLFNGEYAVMKVANKTILVQGEAGVGKTMLCMSILEDWATGRLFQEFQIILYLPLRNVASASSLPELLSVLHPDFNSDTCIKLATYLKKNEDHNVLIIADGWEDLQLSQCRKESFFHSLLFSNDIIPTSSVTVVITTAIPSCIQTHTLEVVDRFITLSGFNTIAVESIIQSEFEDDIRKIRYLIAQLNDNSLIVSICSTPLLFGILCELCRLNSNHAEPLPNTMTELYAKLVWTLATVTMNITNGTCAEVLSLSKHSDLPGGLKRPWQLLCELAFRNVEKGCDTFSQSDASKFMSSELKTISYFGLIKAISESEDTLSLSFVHPYFEQYLASLYLASQPQEVQLTLIQELLVNVECDSKAVIIFWNFFVHNYVRVVESVNPDVIVQILKCISTTNHSTKCSYIIDLCHLSFEAKNPVVNQLIIKEMYNLHKMILKFGYCCNVHDCIAMIYVIGSIMQEHKVEINFQDCYLKPEHINSLAIALDDKSNIIQVTGLNLSGNKLNNSIVVNFFGRAATAFKSLRILMLRSCEIGTSFDIQAILSALTESSCQMLTHLDLSHNPISMSFLQILQGHIQSNSTFDGLQNLNLKGSFESDVSVSFLSCFSDMLASRCKYLRRLDLSDNNLGQPGNPDLSKMISQLLSLGRDFHLCLNEEYMTEVNNEFIYVMEETIKKKGTINHTIAHGVIVGPGRSGKNTLMSRLMGNGPPEPNSTSPSTGVLENIVKVEVKKLSTVAAAVSNLEWVKLEHDEEALELIMTTARHHSLTARISKPIALKYVLKEPCPKEALIKSAENVRHPPKNIAGPKWGKLKDKISKVFKFRKFKFKTGKRNRGSIGKDKETERSRSNAVVYRSDVEPVDIFKRAVKLRGMDALREHLESSWSLYLTNTGGQIEFQEYLPLLVCGPSIFFVIFPLHYDLEKPYNVRYEYPDGRGEEYKSPGTLLEELLQMLATINASNFTSGQQRSSETGIKPKIFFVGTHKDCLSAVTARESIRNKDKLLQVYVKQTSLYCQGSIQFAQAPEQLIFTVNNLSNDDEEFQRIRSAVDQTVERNCFTIECPSSWLILSLVLRAKHKSDQVLTFEKCYSIAQECGITNHTEFKQALSFIHSKLGLIRYFNTDDLNTLVIIDPQILFDRITDLIVKTFTSGNVEANEIEDFRHKGIIPLAIMKKLSDDNHSNSQLPFTWLTKLLNYLRIAALYVDGDDHKYFFPSALCHAPEPQIKQSSNSWPPLLVGFESGFCPRGIPGALIKYLMTNEMKSRTKWEIILGKIFRNQVSFAIQAHEIITLKILPTHLEISCESEEESDDSSEVISTGNELIKKTCELAYAQIRQGMTAVTEQCNECNFYFGFYCTLASTCKVQHPAQIQWGDKNPFKLECKIKNKRGNLPKGYEIWSLQRNLYPGKAQLLDKEIDACNNGILKHLGQIADSMTEWEGRISDELLLTPADVEEIKTQYPNKLKLQKRAALYMWKKRLGSLATYQELINVFESTGYHAYVETVRNIACHIKDDSNDYAEPLSQPETYPQPKPSPPSSPKLATRRFSSCDEFLQINSADAQDLPEGDIYGQNVLESYDVSTVPLLSSKEPEIKPVEPAPSSPTPEPTEFNHQEWLFSSATRREAERWLMTSYNQHGSYLIRNSETDPGGYSLSIRDRQRVRHYRIQQSEDGTFSIDNYVHFKSIVDLVLHHQQEADGLAVKLIYPCIVIGETTRYKYEREIDRRQIKFIKKLLDGEFSELWEGLWNERIEVTIKKRKPQVMTQSDFLRMASLMEKLHHRRIVQLYGVCTQEEPIYIITEHTKRGNLLDYLRREGRLKLTHFELIDISIQVVEGMVYLEERNIIHRGISARNILFGENFGCKVANFETAHEIDEGSIFEAHNETMFLLSKWTAPEAATQNKFSIKSDVWSFGIFLYEVVTYGQVPYPRMSDAQVFKFVQSGNRMPQPDVCPKEIYEIMLHCWQENPENRPTFETLQWQLQTYYDSENDPQNAIFASPAMVLRRR